MTESAGKRILMVVENNCYPGDIRVRREAHSLLAAGYEVSVISPREKHHKARDTVDGVHVFRYPQPQQGDGFVGYLWEYGYSLVATVYLTFIAFWRQGFDIIHCHNPPDLFIAASLPYKLLGKRLIFDHHDLSPEMYEARFGKKTNGLVKNVLVFFERLSCRWANHVIATNESYKKVDVERSRIAQDKVSIVRNGPDLNRIRVVEGDPNLREKAGTILGYVGVMGFQDGVDYLLRALHHLKHDLNHDDFYCVLIGKGDALESLRKLKDELQLNNHVWFTGRIDDEHMLRYLCTADICVDPDPKNPFNDRSTMIKMMEYMALGKPIVAFDLTEHRASANDAALYAEPNDELDFARQIAALVENPSLRQKLGNFGRERIENELGWHHQQKYLIEAYAKLTGYRPNDQERPQSSGAEQPIHIA